MLNRLNTMVNKEELKGAITIFSYALLGGLCEFISNQIPISGPIQFVLGLLLCVVLGSLTFIIFDHE